MRHLFSSGYSISKLIKGGWHLAGGHGPVNPAQAIKDMAAFAQAGITTFDCADIYTGVEELIGQFRQTHPYLAQQVQVHTKYVPDLADLKSLSPAQVEASIDRSLRRLKQEALDLVQFHWWDLSVPGYVEAALELARLHKAGKIRHIGLTNFATAQVREIVEAGVPILSNQVQYSLLDQRPSYGLAQYCQEKGIALLVYGSVAGGFLSEAWLNQPDPGWSLGNRSLVKYRLIIEEFGGWALFQQLMGTVAEVAKKHRASVSQVAVAWVLQQPAVAAAIVGATSTRYLSQNLQIPSLALDGSDGYLLGQVQGQRQGPYGEVYALERDREGRHGRIMRYNENQKDA